MPFMPFLSEVVHLSDSVGDGPNASISAHGHIAYNVTLNYIEQTTGKTNSMKT